MNPLSSEVLHNPVWHALNSGNASMGQGTVLAKSFYNNISPFVGLKNFHQETFDDLTNIPAEDPLAIVTSIPFTAPSHFKLIHSEQILQMVYTATSAITTLPNKSIPLTSEHGPAMLELTQLTRPGPFMKHTIRFGGYYGIYEGERLAAMIGRRFHAGNFIEISAVCTHPDFAGKGLAGILLRDQLTRILAENATPYLHVRTNNESAIALYQKLGFEIHQSMNFMMLKKV